MSRQPYTYQWQQRSSQNPSSQWSSAIPKSGGQVTITVKPAGFTPTNPPKRVPDSAVTMVTSTRQFPGSSSLVTGSGPSSTRNWVPHTGRVAYTGSMATPSAYPVQASYKQVTNQPVIAQATVTSKPKCTVNVSSSMADKKFIDEALKFHNHYRSKHGISNLKQNKEISAQAQRWADTLASKNQFAHCPDADRRYKGDPMGENIAMKWTSGGDDFTGEMVTDQWYSENERYSFNTNSGPRTGHFTQVVWKDSKEFGIGKAKTRDGKWIVVSNYYPAGNIWGKNAENVMPLREGENKGVLRNLFTRDSGKKDSSSSNSSSHTPATGDITVAGGRTVSRHVREEKGPGGYTKTIVTETVTDADGRKTTTTTESVRSGDSDGATATDMRHNANYDAYVSKDRDYKSSYPSHGQLDSRLKSMGVDEKTKTHTTYTTQKSSDSGSKDKKDKEKKPQKMKDFVDEVVKFHNKYRKKHNKVGDVKHNKELDVLAQRWADHLAASSTLKHSNDTYRGDPLGENVATKWSSVGADYTGQEVVDQWYDEVNKYDFRFNDFRPGTGHFTQVVWKNSKEVGVGKSFGRDGRVFVVCNYYPAGNVVGQFKDNVFPEK